jgi:hypothetical protein
MALIIAMLIAALMLHAQVSVIKQSTIPALVPVGPTSGINGFIAVGQHAVGRMNSANPFGWLGFLPLPLSGMPSSVEAEWAGANTRELKVVPNPANAFVRFEGASISQDAVVRIMDVFGRHTYLPIVVSGETAGVRLDGIGNGTYTLFITTSTETLWARLVVSR